MSRRKVQIFSLALLCSGMAWFISNLSETYTSTTTFMLKYTNAPDSLLLVDTSKQSIEAKLEASGFQFLGFNFKRKTLPINLATVQQKQKRHFIAQNDYRRQLEKELPNSIRLVELLDRDTLFFDFFEVYTKTVKINSKLQINLAQNYLLDGSAKITPETITITGPKNEIDTIKSLWTEAQNSEILSSDFSKTLKILKSQDLVHTNFSTENVVVSGKVSRFSERILEIPVRVLNLPEDLKISTFPSTVPVLCQAKLDALKALNVTDFEVTANYNQINDSTKVLTVALTSRPGNIHSTRILKTEIEYILKKE